MHGFPVIIMVQLNHIYSFDLFIKSVITWEYFKNLSS